MSVKEFLQMNGDDGWLIGKNLIVCSECRANVFLKKRRKKHRILLTQNSGKETKDAQKELGNIHQTKYGKYAPSSQNIELGIFSRGLKTIYIFPCLTPSRKAIYFT